VAITTVIGIGCQQSPPTRPSADVVPRAQHVLLIGNSQLGFDPPDLAAAVAELSDARGAAMIVEKAQVMGVGCEGFVQAGTGAGSPLDRVATGHHDVVVLVPAIFETLADSGCWDTFRLAATRAGARFAVMATGHVHAVWPQGITALDAAVRSYAQAHNLLFIPAGEVWLRFADDRSGHEQLALYAGDDAHPGVEGTYLYALTVFGALTSSSVFGLPADVRSLRCPPTHVPCIGADELASHIDDNGDWSGAPPPVVGLHWGGNGKVSVVTQEEATRAQQTVDAVLGYSTKPEARTSSK
jgi:hypothetical protein